MGPAVLLLPGDPVTTSPALQTPGCQQTTERHGDEVARLQSCRESVETLGTNPKVSALEVGVFVWKEWHPADGLLTCWKIEQRVVRTSRMELCLQR